MALSPEARRLNREMKAGPFFNILSRKGKAIYFPKKGFVQQSIDAKDKGINATAGIANEDDGGVMHLGIMGSELNISPERAFSYSPSSGNPELRQLWKDAILEKNPSIKSNMSMPIVTCGITHAIAVAAYLFAEKGVDVIMPDLYWENYGLIFENGFGARLKTFPMFSGKAFNVEGLDAAIGESGRPLVLLNFPNNPTGYTPTDEEAERIAAVIGEYAKTKPLVAVCDDAYFGLVYKEGVFRESLFAKLMEKENVLAVKCDGATKENYAWGFRVGFITFGVRSATKEFYNALENKAIGAIRSSVSSAPTPSQSIVLDSLKDPSFAAQKQEKLKTLKARFDEVELILKEERYRRWLEPLPFNSGYFMCMETKGIDAEKLRKKLLDKYGVGVIAIAGKVRVAYSAIPKQRLRELFDSIVEACEKLSK
jgi:aspartate/methionine/tyrosine aminotransferase